MKQPSKQTAIYCRTAHRDDFGFALDAQKRQLVRYAQEHGCANIVTYMDNGYSGLSFDRPSFAKMQEAIHDGHISTVLVKDVARIGRDWNDVMRWVREVELAGAEIIAIDNPDFPSAELLNTPFAASSKGGDGNE